MNITQNRIATELSRIRFSLAYAEQGTAAADARADCRCYRTVERHGEVIRPRVCEDASCPYPPTPLHGLHAAAEAEAEGAG